LVSTEHIELCKNNNEIGHKAVYESTVRYVLSIVARYINLQHVHKDIVQEVYANVFTNIEQYDEQKGAFKYWIRTIAVNQCLMYLRKNKQLSKLIPLNKVDFKDKAVTIDLSQFERENVKKILTDMPSGYKTIFMLCVIDGYKHDDVSKLLNISKETSRSQLSRAKGWLKTRLNNSSKTQVYGAL